MEPRRLQIPTGMQDTLPGECARKRRLEQEVRRLFALSGYQEVETPVLEFYDTLDDPTYGYRPEHVWKTFDSRGRVLALRPDSTIPSVRLAAGRLREEALPLRLCYVQSANRYESDSLSLLCEETQAGVELMGESSPMADAEVIALAIEALRGAGLKDFQIELGQAGFFDGFMQEAGLTPEQSAVLRELTEQKNTLGMQLYLEKLDVHRDVARRLMRLPRLYGGTEVLDEAEALTAHPLCRGAIAGLRSIIGYLTEYGCASYLTIDLGMVHQANYYSGTIFRGMTADLGQPLLSGGRYDGLPAIGFALLLKLLLMAMERQGASFRPPMPDELVGFAPGCLRQAVEYAESRRAEGCSAVLLYDMTMDGMADRIRRGQARRGVYLTQDGCLRCPKKD